MSLHKHCLVCIFYFSNVCKYVVVDFFKNVFGSKIVFSRCEFLFSPADDLGEECPFILTLTKGTHTR